MTRVLVIDDEPMNHQLVAHALESLKCEFHYAENGKDGIAKARNIRPDVIITDVMMPEINGYETTRLLRRESELSTIPILVLTAQAGLQDKLKSFEVGADDHLTKPFEGPELLARVASLLRRAEFLKASRMDSPVSENAFCIAVHSLRGGVGCSSLAVNLSVGLAELWKKPTILLDLTMTAGQIALMLNMTLRRTWTDIARFAPGELEPEVLASIVGIHDSGVSFIAAPTFPSQADALNNETLSNAIHMLKGQYEYIIADLPHDFSEPALHALDVADIILMIGSPDMASIRAATAALDTYEKLGYSKEKVKFVLNATFPHSALAKDKIETALGLSTFATIPYAQDVFVDAINIGQPLVLARPEHHVSGLLEDFAFHMSKDMHKKAKPENPTETWKRVYKRYQERVKRK